MFRLMLDFVDISILKGLAKSIYVWSSMFSIRLVRNAKVCLFKRRGGIKIREGPRLRGARDLSEDFFFSLYIPEIVVVLTIVVLN